MSRIILLHICVFVVFSVEDLMYCSLCVGSSDVSLISYFMRLPLGGGEGQPKTLTWCRACVEIVESTMNCALDLPSEVAKCVSRMRSSECSMLGNNNRVQISVLETVKDLICAYRNNLDHHTLGSIHEQQYLSQNALHRHEKQAAVKL